MNMSKKDRAILQGLARKVADIAALPIQQQKANMWRRLNRLEHVANQRFGSMRLPGTKWVLNWNLRRAISSVADKNSSFVVSFIGGSTCGVFLPEVSV